MDPATVAAGERGRSTPWVFQTVINRPALMVWAAFCDLRRRAQAIQSIQPQRVNTTTLLSGRQLEAGAVWNMNTVERYIDSDGDARTSVQNVKYTLVKSEPGKCAVFVYESEPGMGYTGKLRMATFFNELPDGRTEVVEEMTDPSEAMTNNAMFWCMVVCSCGCTLCMMQMMLPQLRSQLETALLAFKAHVETLDTAAWMTGVQADLAALKAGSTLVLPFSSLPLPPITTEQQPQAQGGMEPRAPPPSYTSSASLPVAAIASKPTDTAPAPAPVPEPEQGANDATSSEPEAAAAASNADAPASTDA